jgi:hypothetical protein
MSDSKNVLLLRAPSQGSEDRYEAVFNSSLSCTACSVPVLETVLTGLEELKAICLRNPKPSAVICTSSRSCQAWKETVQMLESDSKSKFPGTSYIRY